MTDKAPINPYVVLASAVVLPGSGQVWNGTPLRGLIFIFFMLFLGTVTYMTAKPDISIIGKLAGGMFVHATAIFDAYKMARVRSAIWVHNVKVP